MLQSWAIYNINTGKIICYGREIDAIADQAKIDQGDTECTLYMIQQLCASPDLNSFFCDCGSIDQLNQGLYEIDHALEEVVGMPLADIKIECKKMANNDIVTSYRSMKAVRDCVERLQTAIPDEAIIGDNIEDFFDDLTSAKSTIDTQINALSTTEDALQYYGSRSWLQEFPSPVEWEEM